MLSSLSGAVQPTALPEQIFVQQKIYRKTENLRAFCGRMW